MKKILRVSCFLKDLKKNDIIQFPLPTLHGALMKPYENFLHKNEVEEFGLNRYEINYSYITSSDSYSLKIEKGTFGQYILQKPELDKLLLNKLFTRYYNNIGHHTFRVTNINDELHMIKLKEHINGCISKFPEETDEKVTVNKYSNAMDVLFTNHAIVLNNEIISFNIIRKCVDTVKKCIITL